MGTEITPLEEVKQNLTRMQADFKMVLPPNIQPEKFMRVVITAVQNTPELLAANRPSLYNACIKCAQDGLIPDGQEAALTIFKGSVVYMPMVRGILKKVRNSGELATIDAQVVYEKDEYESWIDEKGQHFKHKKAMKDRGDPVLTYAYALTKDGSLYFEEISEDQIKSIEGISKTATVWKGPFREEMKRKSGIRRLSKRLPMSTDLQGIIERDDELYELPTATNTPAAPTSSRLDRIIEADVEHPTDQPVKDEPAVAVPAETAGNKTLEGIVEEVKKKIGTTNGKTWTKYGIKVAGEWHSTFSDTTAKECEEFKKIRALCQVEYLENEFGRELVSIRVKTAAEMNIPI